MCRPAWFVQMLGLKPGVSCTIGRALCPLSCILSHLELLIPLPPTPRAGITGETPFHFSFCLPSFSSVLSFPFEPGPCQVAPGWPRMQNLALVSRVLRFAGTIVSNFGRNVYSDEFLLNIFQNFIMRSQWNVIPPQAINSTRIVGPNSTNVCLWLLIYLL